MKWIAALTVSGPILATGECSGHLRQQWTGSQRHKEVGFGPILNQIWSAKLAQLDAITRDVVAHCPNQWDAQILLQIDAGSSSGCLFHSILIVFI